MKVLIGYDATQSAKTALDELKRAALPAGTQILAATAGDFWMPPVDAPMLAPSAAVSRRVTTTMAQLERQAAQEIEAAQATAQEAAAQISAQFPQWRVEADWLKGDAAQQLMKKAADWGADLIVVGSQNRSTIGRIFIGSVSRRIVTEAECSVRVARQPLVSDGENAPQRIVVGIDNAETADLMTSAITAREWTKDSVVMLVSATSDEILDEISPVKQITNAQEFQQSVKRKLEERNGLKVLTKIKTGDAQTVLLEEAETFRADCIFVGSRNIRGTVNRWLLGSVSNAVVTNAPCSVEVIRAR